MIKSTKFYEEKDSFLPLRIFGRGENRYLCCPFELTTDDITLQFLEGDTCKSNTQIAHFQVISNFGGPGFKRHFLYSKANANHIFTTSGYMFNGPVKVYSWKMLECPEDIEPYKSAEIETLDLVDMIHVVGDKENKTGGLSDAISEHKKRLEGLSVDSITLEDALRVYNAMRYHVPRY